LALAYTGAIERWVLLRDEDDATRDKGRERTPITARGVLKAIILESYYVKRLGRLGAYMGLGCKFESKVATRFQCRKGRRCNFNIKRCIAAAVS